MKTSLILSICIAFTRVATSFCAVTNVDEVVSARKSDRTGIRFELAGQMIIPPYAKNLPFTVEIDGKCLTFYDRRANTETVAAPGDCIRLEGVITSATESCATILDCTRFTITGRKPVPEPETVDLKSFLTGDFTDRHIAIRGTVKDISPDDIDSRFVDLALSDGSDLVYVYYAGLHSQAASIRSLMRAEVIVSGIGRKNFGSRVFAGASLEIAGTNSIRILRKSFSDPFDAPEVEHDVNDIFQDVRASVMRRISGSVTAVWGKDTFLLQTDDGNTVQVELAEPVLPEIGSTVETAGRLETDLINLYLSRAFWREKTGPGKPRTGKVVDMPLNRLFTNESGSQMTAAVYQGSLIRTTGYVKYISTDRYGFRQMLVTDGNNSIFIDCTTVQEALKSIGEGYRIEVTGICVKDGDLWRPSVVMPKIRGIFLVLRDANDIRVLDKPPWWTAGRLIVILCILLVVIGAILVWNGTLRYMVARKSRELFREQTAKLQETLKISERTRLAAELHDYLAQNLTVVAYQMTAAQTALGERKDDLSNYINTAARMLKSSRIDLRRCLWDLRNDVLDEMNFSKAIEQTIRPVIGKTTLSIRFNGNRTDISDSTAHAILSILRELAANAANHGKAREIRIAGECRPDGIRFSVTDDGCGFDPATAPNQSSGHFGLDGIRERLNRLGGTLAVESSRGHGTYIRFTIASSSNISCTK